MVCSSSTVTVPKGTKSMSTTWTNKYGRQYVDLFAINEQVHTVTFTMYTLEATELAQRLADSGCVTGDIVYFDDFNVREETALTTLLKDV